MVDTPSWLEGHVESLQIPALTTARYDCPVCGAKNTFSVTDDGLQRKWYCFHADCNVKGYTGVTLNSENAASVFTKRASPNTPNEWLFTVRIPVPLWSYSVYQSSYCIHDHALLLHQKDYTVFLNVVTYVGAILQIRIIHTHLAKI